MRPRLLVGSLLVAVLAAVAGCGLERVAVPQPSRRRRRRRGSPGTSLPGRRRRRSSSASRAFTVTRTGWRAEISVENTSSVAWEVGDPRDAAQRAFGVLLFPERRPRRARAPQPRRTTCPRSVPRRATRRRCRPRSAPGETWKGTIAAPGALAGGLWVRLSFGPFASVGDPPKGAQTPVVWFTDHAHASIRSTGNRRSERWTARRSVLPTG